MKVATIEWVGGLDGCVRIIDQTLLPNELRVMDCRNKDTVFEAIRSLRVRGAPAIGVAAAMGAVLGIRDSATDDSGILLEELRQAAAYLAEARPTAVNLSWALARMVRTAEEKLNLNVPELKRRLLQEAVAIGREDAQMCRAIGEYGAPLIKDGDGVLTHCNAGALATTAYGTALSVLFVAHEQGRVMRVYADETRPLLQGSRLTAWELMQAGIDATVLCDNMAGALMQEGKIQRVIVGADCIAANGDTANKIGTYSLAVLAKEHDIPFYVAAPSSTFDLSLPDGSGIPIEQRDPAEVAEAFGRRTAPEGVKIYNPAFDVTPHRYITAMITEKGIIERPDTASIRSHFD